MNGLRVYTNTQHQETQGGFTIFTAGVTTARYYRWSYEEQRKTMAGRARAHIRPFAERTLLDELESRSGFAAP